MKKVFFRVAIVVALVSLGACASPRIVSPKNASNKLDGVWRKVTPGRTFDITKFMSEGRFLWAWTPHGSPTTITSSAGGTFTFDGQVHTETIEFSTANNSALVGQQAVVVIRFEGNNRFYTSGILAGRIPLNEVWERIE